MKKVVVLSALGLVGALILGRPTQANPNPSCYMTEPDGTVVNLGRLCGENPASAAPASSTAGSPGAASDSTGTSAILPLDLSAAQSSNSSGTIFTPEMIAYSVNECTREAQAQGVYVSENQLRSYCQCSIDNIRNRYTSQEFVMVIAPEWLAGIENNFIPTSLQETIEPCIRFLF